MYMLISSGPLTDRKLSAHSVATAFASSVLPVPGVGSSVTPAQTRRGMRTALQRNLKDL